MANSFQLVIQWGLFCFKLPSLLDYPGHGCSCISLQDQVHDFMGILWNGHETLKLLCYNVTIYNNVGNVLNLGTELFQHGSKNNHIRGSTQQSQQLILLRWKAICFDEWLSRSIEMATSNWTLIVYHTQFLVKLQHKMMSCKGPTKPIPGFEPVGEALEILKAIHYIHTIMSMLYLDITLKRCPT